MIDSLLFSLAIAVGITPQLLPAVVSTSLASGSRRLAQLKVLVKRLVCIEDLGDIDILITDKTGTLTEGPDRAHRRRRPGRQPRGSGAAFGLLATDVDPATGGVSANELDTALWKPGARIGGVTRIGDVAVRPQPPGDLRVRRRDGRAAGGQGRPEQVLARCDDVPSCATHPVAAIRRRTPVVAVASRPAPALGTHHPADEAGLCAGRLPGVRRQPEGGGT